jgi:hypothetical protein
VVPAGIALAFTPIDTPKSPGAPPMGQVPTEEKALTFGGTPKDEMVAAHSAGPPAKAPTSCWFVAVVVYDNESCSLTWPLIGPLTTLARNSQLTDVPESAQLITSSRRSGFGDP